VTGRPTADKHEDCAMTKVDEDPKEKEIEPTPSKEDMPAPFKEEIPPRPNEEPPAPAETELPVPTEIVENPKAVMKTDLTDKEKLNVLEEAEAHAQRMMDSAGEGMTGDDLPALDEVRESIDKLKAKDAPRWTWNGVRAKAAQLTERWGKRPRG